MQIIPKNDSKSNIFQEKKGFTNLLSRLPSGKALPTSHYDNEFVLATLNKILENIIVNSDCKKRNY